MKCDTQPNDTQHNGIQIFVILSGIWSVAYAECHKQTHYGECRNSECHHSECHYSECHYAECHLLSVIMLSVIVLSVIMLSIIMLSIIMLSIIMLSIIILSVIMLSIIMLSVVAPSQGRFLAVKMTSFGHVLRQYIGQGTLTEEEGSIRLTSLY
jgi:hypothetical protein